MKRSLAGLSFCSLKGAPQTSCVLAVFTLIILYSRRVHPCTGSQLEGIEGPHLGEEGQLRAHLRGMVS